MHVINRTQSPLSSTSTSCGKSGYSFLMRTFRRQEEFSRHKPKRVSNHRHSFLQNMGYQATDPSLLELLVHNYFHIINQVSTPASVLFSDSGVLFHIYTTSACWVKLFKCTFVMLLLTVLYWQWCTLFNIGVHAVWVKFHACHTFFIVLIKLIALAALILISGLMVSPLKTQLPETDELKGFYLVFTWWAWLMSALLFLRQISIRQGLQTTSLHY